MYRDFAGQDLHYFDRIPYLGSYTSPDSKLRLVYSVLRFPPAQDYFAEIRRDFQAKAEFGKKRGIITSMEIRPERKLGRFRNLELRMNEPDGGQVIIATLFDAAMPYQVVQVQLFSEPGMTEAAVAVFARVLETIQIDFKYRVRTKNHEIVITNDAQRFLVIADIFNSGAEKFLLVFQEPHWDYVSQEHLLYGINQIFSDNDFLFGNSAILTEGYPDKLAVDTWSLFAEDPFCDADLVSLILESYLIPGHVAFGWCSGNLVPILGTETWADYQTSVSLWLQGKLEEWSVSVVARNAAIARATLEATKIYDNSMLVVGGMHLSSIDEEVFRKGTRQDSMKSPAVLNQGVADFLASAGWGIVYLEPVPNVNLLDDLTSRGRYAAVLKIESEQEYERYRKEFVSSHPLVLDAGGGVNASPNTQQASKLLRELKTRHARIGSKTPNVPNGQALKGELRGVTERLVGILRAALRGTGDFSLGKASRRIADLLGRAWVGPGAGLSSGGTAWISKDKLRQYRPPSYRAVVNKGE